MTRDFDSLVWTFTCPVLFVGPVIGARARVSDSGGIVPFNNLTVVLGEDGGPTLQATDLSPATIFPLLPVGDSAGSSPFAFVPDGPGTYAMAFKKSGLSAEGYVGEAECVRVFPFAPFQPALIRHIDQ